jgi:penicillin G amidase
MICSIAAFVAFSSANPKVLTRDEYGVPVIRAKSVDEAMQWAGYATAQDRMWQMEMSRRTAQSQLAEVFGEKSYAADQQQFQQFYNQTELRQQFDQLPKNIQSWFKSYSKGVNQFIQEGKLPKQYEENGLKPRPWTEIDSAAITIQLLQIFGRGGAGELRNLALLKYLEAQSKIGKKALDVFDDLVWENDPTAIPTCFAEDDKVKPPSFPKLNPVQTLKHLTQIPELSMFELLPGARVVSLDRATEMRESLKVPYKSGSYCVVLSPSVTKSRTPMLLSGPQMGFTIPSIVHEISIHAPGLDVAGMAVPGVPGVMVGATPNAAWGLTTGVADTEDIYVSMIKNGNYIADGTEKPIRTIRQEVKVKGLEPKFVARQETEFGPLVYQVPNKFVGFSRARVYAGRELQSYEAVSGLWTVKTRADFEKSVRRATMNFNCFVALKSGEIGWRYLGEVPVRASEYDPRFPLPSKSSAKWKGVIPFGQMPTVWNPKRGWIANWNNKPVDWWPNLDTPAWGPAFRVGVIFDQMNKTKWTRSDLESLVSHIGQTSPTWRYMKPVSAVGPLSGYNGALLANEVEPAIYNRFIQELRNELLMPITGNFASADNFALVAQPDLILKALRGESKFDYLAGRDGKEIVNRAMEKAVRGVNGAVFKPSTIPVPPDAGEPINFRDRGTYLQIVELGKESIGSNVVTPGVAESGPHSFDQAKLSRSWGYKSMVIK